MYSFEWFIQRFLLRVLKVMYTSWNVDASNVLLPEAVDMYTSGRARVYDVFPPEGVNSGTYQKVYVYMLSNVPVNMYACQGWYMYVLFPDHFNICIYQAA